LKLAVRTYDYAALQGNTLLNAEQHALEIFHRAGIALVWVDRSLPTAVPSYVRVASAASAA